MIVLDFETRSTVDIFRRGSSVYARDPSTEIMCLVWGDVNGGPLDYWQMGNPPPFGLFHEIRKGTLLCAHNAAFERRIWNHICVKRMDWEPVPFEQWRCSLACCCRLTLPRGLEKAGAALGLEVVKDVEGNRLMKKMCKPLDYSSEGEPIWSESAVDVARLLEYCEADVRSQIALVNAIEPLTKSELRVWQLDQRINETGLPIDREGIVHALSVVEQIQAEACAELQEITGGKIQAPTQVAQIREVLSDWYGLSLPNLKAETVAEAKQDPELHPEALRILELREIGSKASTGKLKAFLNFADEDDRIRGTLVYHGAGPGRWAGAGLQPQNFPRGHLKPAEIEIVHSLLPLESSRALNLVLDSPIECLSSSLRSFIRAAEGRKLLVSDFAQIEARVLAWIAEQSDLVETFRQGLDVYKVMAGAIYDVDPEDVTGVQRFVGKTAVLGLGYGMGHKNFVRACWSMAGVEIDRKFANQVVNTYRERNDKIKAFWRSINTAAIRAVETCVPHTVGRLEIAADKVTRAGKRAIRWLTIRLPSGRHLHYCDPKVVKVRAPWSIGYHGVSVLRQGASGEKITKALEDRDVNVIRETDEDGLETRILYLKQVPLKLVALIRRTPEFESVDLEPIEPEYIKQIEYSSVNSTTKKWVRTRTYGGKLTENVCQGIARDFLVEAMLRVDRAGFRIIATVHDEIVDEDDENADREEFDRIMSQVPRWGRGCPIAAEGYTARRYKK